MNTVDSSRHANRTIHPAWIVCIALAALSVGCQNNGGPVDDADLARLRKQASGNEVVGVVTELESRGLPFAAVGQLNTSGVRFGDAARFVDSNGTALTNGVVRRVNPSELHVEWSPPAGNGRAPRVGDAAIVRRGSSRISDMPPAPMTPAPVAPAPAAPAAAITPAAPAAPAAPTATPEPMPAPAPEPPSDTMPDPIPDPTMEPAPSTNPSA